MKIEHIIVVSDIHAGSSVAVCPPNFKLDDGGVYRFSRMQSVLWSWWQEFWTEWVPMVTAGDPYIVIVNGDIIDGQVKGSTAQVSVNMEDQARIALELLDPVAKAASGIHIVRGTEAHNGKSGLWEERIAESLGARKAEGGRYSSWDLWMNFKGQLIHFAHHIGCTSSTAAETSALSRELSAAFVESGQFHNRYPDMIVRSHRHRFSQIAIPTAKDVAQVVVTPSWQLHTPHGHRLGLSMRTPQIGGICISHGGGGLFIRQFIKAPTRGKAIVYE